MKIIISTAIVGTFLIANNSLGYYQAQQGRWISRDPLGDKVELDEQLKQAKSKDKKAELIRSSYLPSYLFVENNPIVFIDIDGLSQYGYGGGYGEIGRAIISNRNQPRTVETSGTLGAGGYYVFGGAGSVTSGTCCKSKKRYKYTVVKACTGMGIGAGIYNGAGGSISTSSTCPPELKVTVAAGFDNRGFLIGGEADLVSGNASGPGFGDLNFGATWKIVEVCTHTRTKFEEDGCCDE